MAVRESAVSAAALAALRSENNRVAHPAVRELSTREKLLKQALERQQQREQEAAAGSNSSSEARKTTAISFERC